MARKFLNQSRTPRSSRRSNKAWASHFDAAAVTVAAGTKALLGGLSLSNPNIDETVLRTVGSVITQTDAPAVSEKQFGAFGLIRVSDAAAAVGITAIPGPVTDADDDGWFVYVPLLSDNRVNTAVGVVAGVRYDFDSKAKRVFEEGTQIAIVVENAHASHAFSIASAFRLLGMVTGT